MPELYPVTLQDNFSRGTFKRMPGENKIFSKMDSGPFKVRRRTTLRRDTINGTILLRNISEYNDFQDWYTDTLKDGTLSFNFKDPATYAPIVCQFVDKGVTISDVGFETFSVAMQMEIISE